MNTIANSEPSFAVFINYRRDDSSGYAGRLYDRLCEHFDPEYIFIDVSKIKYGKDFTRAIENSIGSAKVLLAIIGRNWLTITDKSGMRRLDDPEDFVSLEIATAINKTIEVIPLLVDDAIMPSKKELPEALKPLAHLNTLELSYGKWEYDVGQLIKILETEHKIPLNNKLTKSPKINRQWLIGLPLGLLVLFSIFSYVKYNYDKNSIVENEKLNGQNNSNIINSANSQIVSNNNFAANTALPQNGNTSSVATNLNTNLPGNSATTPKPPSTNNSNSIAGKLPIPQETSPINPDMERQIRENLRLHVEKLFDADKHIRMSATQELIDEVISKPDPQIISVVLERAEIEQARIVKGETTNKSGVINALVLFKFFKPELLKLYEEKIMNFLSSVKNNGPQTSSEAGKVEAILKR